MLLDFPGVIGLPARASRKIDDEKGNRTEERNSRPVKLSKGRKVI